MKTYNNSDDELLDEACLDLAYAGEKLLEMESEVGIRLMHMIDALLCYIENTIYDDVETYGLKKPKHTKLEAVK